MDGHASGFTYKRLALAFTMWWEEEDERGICKI